MECIPVDELFIQTRENKEGLIDGDKSIFYFLDQYVKLFRMIFFNRTKPLEAYIHYDISQINIPDSIFHLSIVALLYPR